MAGDHRAALRTIEETFGQLETAPRRDVGDTDLIDPTTWLTMMRGWVLFEMGRVAEGEALLDRAGVRARELGQAEIAGWVAEFGIYRAELRGDVRAALDCARRALEVADRLGSALSRCSALLSLAEALILGREWTPAIATLEQALALVRERRTGLQWEALMLAKLAEAQLGAGDVASAGPAAEDAVRLAHARGTRLTECHAQRALARVLRHRDGAGARNVIADALARALALVEETGARLYEPFIRVELAELARLTGDEPARARETTAVVRLFGEMGVPERALA